MGTIAKLVTLIAIRLIVMAKYFYFTFLAGSQISLWKKKVERGMNLT